METRHTGPVLPTTDHREFAYEDEIVSRPAAVIQAYPQRRRGRKSLSEQEQSERDKYAGYEFSIRQHTNNALEITLRKERADIVAQRKTGGQVVTHDVYHRILSFAELTNLLFSRSQHYEDCEAYPDSIHQAMKTAYRD